MPFQPRDKSGESYTFVPMKPHHLILFFLFSALAVCHSSTHDVKQCCHHMSKQIVKNNAIDDVF